MDSVHSQHAKECNTLTQSASSSILRPLPMNATNDNYDVNKESSSIENPHNDNLNSTTAIGQHPPVLLNTFIVRKKRFRVCFHANKLVWEQFDTKKDKINVHLTDIISIDPNLNDDATETQSKPFQFIVYYAKRSKNSSNQNKWRYHSCTFYNSDPNVVRLWVETVQNAINEQQSRPKRLLLFVNPFGGKRRALQIYDSNVKPIFQIAGIDASVVISQRSNQIRDFILTQSLDNFDGIVCIGGDGTFSEVFNGLIFRTLKDLELNANDVIDTMPAILKPIGVIPAGSTDTVAYCINGTTDICTNVLNIVLGQINGLDLSSVSTVNGVVKFYASVMSYGFLGDVAVESEKFRWMGPKRYDYSGFKKLLLNRGYEGEITMELAPVHNEPSKGPKCVENCPMCDKNVNKNKLMSVINLNGDIDSVDNCNGQLFRKNEIRVDEQNEKLEKLKNVLDNNNDVNINENSNRTKVINGKFFMVNGANISCACARSPNGLSKYCHLCDGYIDLILVRHTSFVNNIKFLLSMSSQNYTMITLPQVEIYRTKRFCFRPSGLQSSASGFNLHSSRLPINSSDSPTSTVWNCDGEILHEAEVMIRSHRGLVNVYRRGLYNEKNDENAKTTNCCSCFG